MEQNDGIEKIKKYFRDLSVEKIKKFRDFADILKKENEKINLISRKDIENLYEHHILHSLAIAKIYRFNEEDRIVDIGTGGGFPGIPLAIYFENVEFVLVDSIKKKVNIVNKIVEILGIKNVNVVCERAENMREKFDYIIGRGVSNINDFVKNTVKLLRNENSRIIYMNGAGDNVSECYKNYFIKTIFADEYFREKQIVEIGI